MGPVSYVIAILGCTDGAAACQQVALSPSPDVLAASTDFDFPPIVARCRSTKSPAAVQRIPARKAGQTIKEG
jgi:hypothetical protein